MFRSPFSPLGLKFHVCETDKKFTGVYFLKMRPACLRPAWGPTRHSAVSSWGPSQTGSARDGGHRPVCQVLLRGLGLSVFEDKTLAPVYSYASFSQKIPWSPFCY